MMPTLTWLAWSGLFIFARSGGIPRCSRSTTAGSTLLFEGGGWPGVGVGLRLLLRLTPIGLAGRLHGAAGGEGHHDESLQEFHVGLLEVVSALRPARESDHPAPGGRFFYFWVSPGGATW